MAVKITKKDRETAQSLVHRFTKTVRQSGVLLQIRKGQFFKRTKSDLVKKRSALRKVRRRAERAIEEKMAKPK